MIRSDAQRKAMFARLAETTFYMPSGAKITVPHQFAIADDIRDIVRKAKFELDPAAKAYLDALDESDAMYGDKGVRTQAFYILNNLRPKGEEQKLAAQQLLAIGKGETIPEAYTPEPEDTMSEIELERITDSLTDYMIKKARMRSDAGGTGDFLLQDYKDFAEEYGYPLDKVLVSNDWVEESLTKDILDAIEGAKKRVKIDWG